MHEGGKQTHSVRCASPPFNRDPHPPCTQVNEGTVDVDQSALTGESLPVTLGSGESAKMGSMVVRGEVEATVEVREGHGEEGSGGAGEGA